MVKHNMKKYALFIVILTLLLAGLACNLPSQAPAAEVPAVIEPADGFKTENRVIDDIMITIALPESYYVSDSGADLSALVGGVGDSGASINGDLQNLLSSAQEDILIWGYDAGSAADVPPSFVVIRNEDYAAMPLGIISTFAGTLLGNNVEILEETRLTIAGRDTLRWITLTREAGLELIQAVYLFKESGSLYLVGFNADRQSVYAQLGVFDAIVASLNIAELE